MKLNFTPLIGRFTIYLLDDEWAIMDRDTSELVSSNGRIETYPKEWAINRTTQLNNQEKGKCKAR